MVEDEQNKQAGLLDSAKETLLDDASSEQPTIDSKFDGTEIKNILQMKMVETFQTL